MGHPLNLKAFFPDGVMIVVFFQGKKCKITCIDWGVVPVIEKEAL
jgi:hypothetical protein